MPTANTPRLSVSSATPDSSVDFSTDSTLWSPVLDEFPPIPHANDPEQFDLHGMSLARDKENRDSGLSTVTVTPATIATAAVARSARGNVIVSPVHATDDGRAKTTPLAQDVEDTRPHSPNSAESHSSASSISTTASLSMSIGTESASSDSRPQTLTTETQDWRLPGGKPRSLAYTESPEPSPRAASFAERDVFTVSVTSEGREQDVEIAAGRRPSIVIDHFLSATAGPDNKPVSPVSPASAKSPSPMSPAPRYPGWLSAVVAPLKSFINDQVDPRDLYADLREIAEGESGSVFAARVLDTAWSPEKLQPGSFVAIKNVPILPSGSPKIDDLRRELTMLKGLFHVHVLTLDALYVDLVEDSLWIRMDLMERSLADVIAYVDEGVVIHEKSIARIARDVRPSVFLKGVFALTMPV